MPADNITQLGNVREITIGDRALDTDDPGFLGPEGDLEIEVDLDEGSAETLGLMGESEPDPVEHDANLAEYIAEAELQQMSSDLMAAIEADKDTRSEWEEYFQEGLKLMGVRGTNSGDLAEHSEDELFKGASQLFHPLITEACVHFQAEALKAMLPPSGPAGTKIMGEETPEKLQQATRVREYINYQTTTEIRGYFEEHDKLLMYLGKSGSAFKKITFNKTSGRLEVTYLPAEDMIVPYNARSMADADRITQIERNISVDKVAHRVANGLYRQIDMSPSSDTTGEVQETLDDQVGTTASSYMDQDSFTIYTVMVDMVMPGFEDDRGDLSAPYIVHIEADSGQVLGVYRNWREGDPLYARKDYFVHYVLVQSDGFYGYGFIHLLGQLAKGASATLRQLLDAGTLSNLQGGFKRKGTRMARDGEPMEPGEFRDVSTASDRISDSIMQLKFNEPSTVLYQLMGFLVDAGRRMVSMTDLNVGDGNQEAAVGTTIAMLEQGAKVMSAVHMRLCRAMKEELRIIARLSAEHMPEEYPYDVPGETRSVFREDFNNRVDVLPICDPKKFSEAQRISRAQSKLQLAQQFPEVLNKREAVRDMMMEVDDTNIDRIMPPEQEAEPKDPMTENMDSLIGEPLKAFVDQNHEAHIEAHMAHLENPQFQDNAQLRQSLQAHIQEHMAMQYQVAMMEQMGVDDPAQLQELPPEQVAVAAAQATKKITGQAQALAEAEQRAAEPTFEQRMLEAEMDNDQKEVERKREADRQKFLTEQAKIKQDDRDAELRAAADIFRARKDGETADTRNYVSLIQALQNANQREQLRDAGTRIT